jgi:predicted enzyme involved in methoxymalonyl-ACP biosynthesis
MSSLQELKYSEILTLNRELGSQLSSEPEFSIALLSNIIVNQLKDILEYSLRKENIAATVLPGDYDNIVQDSSKLKNSSAVIIFWEICNLTDGFQYNANIINDDELNSLIQKTKGEIGFVINELKNTPLVIFNKFSSLIFNHLQIKKNNLDRVCEELNDYLEKECPANFFIVDIDKVIARRGVESSIDLRYYFSSKALYSIDFFKIYSQYILPVIFSIKGKSKKALILDCDNT